MNNDNQTEMNRAKLVARVAELERHYLAAKETHGFAHHVTNEHLRLWEEARAELAAMPKGPRRFFQCFDKHGNRFVSKGTTPKKSPR